MLERDFMFQCVLWLNISIYSHINISGHLCSQIVWVLLGEITCLCSQNCWHRWLPDTDTLFHWVFYELVTVYIQL